MGGEASNIENSQQLGTAGEELCPGDRHSGESRYKLMEGTVESEQLVSQKPKKRQASEWGRGASRAGGVVGVAAVT